MEVGSWSLGSCQRSLSIVNLSPMLATLAEAPLQSRLLVYEPKYDGIRALVEIRPGTRGKDATVRLWSRNGNEKTSQFPTIVHALQQLALRSRSEDALV